MDNRIYDEFLSCFTLRLWGFRMDDIGCFDVFVSYICIVTGNWDTGFASLPVDFLIYLKIVCSLSPFNLHRILLIFLGFHAISLFSFELFYFCFSFPNHFRPFQHCSFISTQCLFIFHNVSSSFMHFSSTHAINSFDSLHLLSLFHIYLRLLHFSFICQ